MPYKADVESADRCEHLQQQREVSQPRQGADLLALLPLKADEKVYHQDSVREGQGLARGTLSYNGHQVRHGLYPYLLYKYVGY